MKTIAFILTSIWLGILTLIFVLLLMNNITMENSGKLILIFCEIQSIFVLIALSKDNTKGLKGILKLEQKEHDRIANDWERLYHENNELKTQRDQYAIKMYDEYIKNVTEGTFNGSFAKFILMTKL